MSTIALHKTGITGLKDMKLVIVKLVKTYIILICFQLNESVNRNGMVSSWRGARLVPSVTFCKTINFMLRKTQIIFQYLPDLEFSVPPTFILIGSFSMEPAFVNENESRASCV